MPLTRQLAAIFFADIQGFTAIMQHDEAKAKLIRNKFNYNTEQATVIAGWYNTLVMASCACSAVQWKPLKPE